MKTLTIVGNGFDLGHGLKTSFDQFIKSNEKDYSGKYAVFKNGENSWSEVESVYRDVLVEIIKNRSWVDATEIVDKIIETYGLNEYGEVDYYNYYSEVFNEEFNKIKKFVDLLYDFEADFKEYLLNYCGDNQLNIIPKRKIISEILNMSSRIITFNYTKTIEKIYGIDDVEHIHGSVDSSIAIGSGSLDFAKESLVDIKYPTIDTFGKDKFGLQELMFYYDYDDEGNEYEKVFIKRFFDEVSYEIEKEETELFKLLDIKSKDMLESRIKIINSLKNEKYDEVYIIGHSMGEMDFSVFDAIDKNALVIFFYYSENDKDRVEKVFIKLNIKHKLISTKALYKWKAVKIKEREKFVSFVNIGRHKGFYCSEDITTSLREIRYTDFFDYHDEESPYTF